MVARVVAMLAPLATAVSQPSMDDFRRSAMQLSGGWGLSVSKDSEPITYEVDMLRRLDHEGAPWTQGLEVSKDGKLIETSGDYPKGVGSFVRVLDPETGRPQRVISDGLKDKGGQDRFIEGIVERAGRWHATTYEAKVAIEYDSDFKVVGEHPFPFIGWGLTLSPDGESFLATNGSEYVMSLSTDNWQLKSTKTANCMGKRVKGLNELEMVEDFEGTGPALLGNLINTRLVYVLDPNTMNCTGVFHLEDLENVEPLESRGFHVANGIAYSKKTGSFFVTGKNWRNMYEIKLSRQSAGQGASSYLRQRDSRAIQLLYQSLDRARPLYEAPGRW